MGHSDIIFIYGISQTYLSYFDVKTNKNSTPYHLFLFYVLSKYQKRMKMNFLPFDTYLSYFLNCDANYQSLSE